MIDRKERIEEILEKVGTRYGMDVGGISYVVNAHKLSPYLQPKIPKNALVISKKDYEDYEDLFKNFDNYLFEYRKFADNRIKETREETAKEIERDLEDKGYFEYGQFTISGNDFIEIFKKRGVEVE